MKRASIILVGLSCLLGVLAPTGCTAPVDAAAGSPERSPDLTSNLQVDAGQQFIFAGEPDTGPYTASVMNKGRVAVTLLRRQGDVATRIATLQPGEKAVQKFQRGEAAVFANATSEQAMLLVYVWGDTQVGMRYEPVK